MAAPVILISSDSSEESVGSHVPRVNLFGTIPSSYPIIHLLYDSINQKIPLAYDQEFPWFHAILCSDDSEADSESESAEQRPERHESLTPSSEFPLAPVVAPPRIR
ncbi:hypothetical protein Tco_1393771 [Tanacetum coccineum]